MLGVLSPGPGRLKAEQVSILGLPVLWVSVPEGGYWEKRRVARAERLLLRSGVRRRLLLRDAPEWAVSVPEVDPLALYRAMADRLTLEELKGRGVEPCRSTVVLVGEQMDSDLVRTAHLLCPRVRVLGLEVGRGGERLARELYREFGAAVSFGGQADVRVRFSGPAQPGELVLCRRPELLGITVEAPALCLPEQLEPVPLLTALWQAGRIDVKDLRLRYKSVISVAKSAEM